jgi:threonine aldolase
MTIVDLRSDTVTRPSRHAQGDARGRARRRRVRRRPDGQPPAGARRRLFGFEAALLFPTGTQSNLAALMSHCGRGEEVILGTEAHSYRYEAGGVSVLASIQPQTVPNRPTARSTSARSRRRSSPTIRTSRARACSRWRTRYRQGLSQEIPARPSRCRDGKIFDHLDGARIFNAAAQLKMNVKDLCRRLRLGVFVPVEGPGAPAGTVLWEMLIDQKAKRARKILGGGMRQSGVIARRAVCAREQRRASEAGLTKRGAAGARPARARLEVQLNTNMVMVRLAAEKAQPLAEHLRKPDLVLPRAPMRLVTHLDVDGAGIDRALEVRLLRQPRPR